MKKNQTDRFVSTEGRQQLTDAQQQFTDKLMVYWRELRQINTEKEVVKWFEKETGYLYLLVNRQGWPLVELSNSLYVRLLDYSSACDLETLALAPETIPLFRRGFFIVLEQQAGPAEGLSKQSVN